jgi:hypothetical protein
VAIRLKCTGTAGKTFLCRTILIHISSVAEARQIDAAPGKNFEAAPAPTLLHAQPNCLKQTKVVCATDFFRYLPNILVALLENNWQELATLKKQHDLFLS